MRCRSCSPGECGSSRTGSARPGRKTSSARFASAITATRGRSKRCIAASAAESWPLPPSITTRFGTAAKPSSYSSSTGLLIRAKRRSITCAIAEVILAVEPAHRELAVVPLLRGRILEDNHRADRLRSLDVRDVETLDPQRQALQVEPLAQLLERL